VTATLVTTNLATPLRPLAETAAQFRQECSALDHLVEELYRDVEQLREELLRKGDEVEEGRRKLAQRGALLADQRKETSRLVHFLEQQDARSGEALSEIKSLREQVAREREEIQQREAARAAFLEQKLRAAEAERDQLRHEINVLQASAAAAGGNGGSAESLAPLMSELGDLRRQLGETQGQLMDARAQLGEAIERATKGNRGNEDLAPVMSELVDLRSQFSQAHTQLGEAIERAAAAAAHAPPLQGSEGLPADEATLARLAEAKREQVELESELELVRTRATELQEVVNQQRRELVEQRADVTTELRLLRELVEQRPHHAGEEYEPEEESALVGASSRSAEPTGPAPDPVVSSVMAQFARLQKDVAQRRKKK
jgi:chromosome segregation ATPase